jgi:hypothetical protein
MWYEMEMIEETMTSIRNSLSYYKGKWKLDICINLQTYLESPLEGSKSPYDMISPIISSRVNGSEVHSMGKEDK